MASTYMGKRYYPAWLNNLADDVTGEGAAWDGAFEGAETVRSVVVGARELYENQLFSYAGPCGDFGFLEEYTTEVRGVHLKVVVTVTFNEAGQAQRVVVNHRPRTALLFLSRATHEKFAGTPIADHFLATEP
jgi:hypothetical protein